MSVLLSRINQYWSQRACDFARIRYEEMCGDKLKLWSAEILPYLPKRNRPLQILDIGTGAGFFALLMSTRTDSHVIGIDICQGMLREASKLSRVFGCNVTFRAMDASKLDFPDAYFDCLLARNLTWTLLEPVAAYTEWIRVLRPGGVLLNFDAHYGAVDFTHTDSGKNAHANLDKHLLLAGESIRRTLPLTSKERPFWDLSILRKLQVSSVTLDTELSKRIYRLRDMSYNPVPMFALRVVK